MSDSLFLWSEMDPLPAASSAYIPYYHTVYSNARSPLETILIVTMDSFDKAAVQPSQRLTVEGHSRVKRTYARSSIG